MTTVSAVPKVYAALDAVRQAIDKLGIAKAREVTDGVKFFFRGIDDVMDVFSGPMAEAKLMAMPHYGEDLVVTERATNAGKPNYNTRATVKLEFLSLVDGSTHWAGPFHGEASDTGDKSTAKAQSIAYRQGFLLTFVVPLGPAADVEADEEQIKDANAEPVQKTPVKANGKPKPPAKSTGKPGIHDLKESQLNVLARKRDMANVTEKELLQQFPSINLANINEVFAWLKERTQA